MHNLGLIISKICYICDMVYLLILFILINTGFAIGVTRSTLVLPFRNYVISKNELLGKIIGCPMCFGFWSSIPTFWYVYRILDGRVIGFMFVGSFAAHFFNKVIN